MNAYTADQIARALGVDRTAVVHRAKKEGWPQIEDGRRRPYPVTTLPADIRLALARADAANASDWDGDDEDTYKEGLEGLTGAALHRAEARLYLLATVQQYAKLRGLKLNAAERAFAEEYQIGLIEVPDWVREWAPKASYSSLRGWRRQMKKAGAKRLGLRYGNRKGDGLIDRDPELRSALRGLMQKFPDGKATLYEQALLAKFGPRRTPHVRVIAKWRDRWIEEHRQLHEALCNPDGHRSKHQVAFGKADDGVFRLNQRWEMDSTKADVLLADGTRHTIIGVVDVWSRRLKLHVSKASNAAAVLACFKKAVLAWGLPDEAKTDNGSDYVSKHARLAFASLGVMQTICRPFHPEDKPFIERALGTFSHGIFESISGFIGHSVSDRKRIESRKAFAERLGQRDEAIEISLTAEELQEYCDAWCENVYQHDTHKGLGTTPFLKAQSWLEPVQMPDARALDVLLLPPADGDPTRRVRKKGVRVAAAPGKSIWYQAPELGELVGQDVFVKCGDDLGHVHIYVDGEKPGEIDFVCVAVDPEHAGLSRQELALAARAKQKAYLAQAKKEVREAARNVGDVNKEIMEYRAREAGKLSGMPRRTVEYEGGSIMAGAEAAAAQDTPQQRLTPEQEAMRKQLAEKQPQAMVTQLPETPRQRYRRWADLDARIQASDETVTDQERKWHCSYRQTGEWWSWNVLARREQEQAQAAEG